jgi:hypothetical protein
VIVISIVSAGRQRKTTWHDKLQRSDDLILEICIVYHNVYTGQMKKMKEKNYRGENTHSLSLIYTLIFWDVCLSATLGMQKPIYWPLTIHECVMFLFT